MNNSVRKGIITFSLILFTSAMTLAQFIAGPKMGFDSHSGQGNLGLKFGVISDEKFKIAADFGIFSGSSSYVTSQSPKYTRSEYQDYFECNLNFSYLFKHSRAYLYPLIGMNIYRDYYSYEYYGQHSSDNYELVVKDKIATGLNIGGGAMINYGIFSPYIEAKYSVSKIQNSSISGGVLINVDLYREKKKSSSSID